jgi:hypothetical protein
LSATRLLLAVVFYTCLYATELLCQQVVADSCDVPVVVTDYQNNVVRNLVPADFSVRLGGTSRPVASAFIDSSSKRVALIIDASKNIPEEEWKLETDMAAQLVSHARPEDRFVFYVIGGQGTTDKLLSSSEISEHIEELRHRRPAVDANEKIYDTILAAAKRLDPPQFGDAIFLFGHHEDSGSNTSADYLLERILKNRVRFFAISFADKLAKLPPGFNLNKPLPKEFGRSTLETASAETGYFFSFHPVRALQMPGQLPLFENFLSDLYTWIAEPYRLKVPASSVKDRSKVEITLAAMEERRIHRDGVHYFHMLYSCADQLQKAP